ncbi:hypothetical protein [Pseudonocardia sp. T1-2H]|uniref:hypothetical protein n=1 Tax=Pseudonocardia sp. T1-2H TaxID=3128899 RepID=UPI0031015F23
MTGLGSGKLEASLSNRMNNRPERPSAPTIDPFDEQLDRSIQARSGEVTRIRQARSGRTPFERTARPFDAPAGLSSQFRRIIAAYRAELPELTG